MGEGCDSPGKRDKRKGVHKEILKGKNPRKSKKNGKGAIWRGLGTEPLEKEDQGRGDEKGAEGPMRNSSEEEMAEEITEGERHILQGKKPFKEKRATEWVRRFRQK